MLRTAHVGKAGKKVGKKGGMAISQPKCLYCAKSRSESSALVHGSSILAPFAPCLFIPDCL